MKSSMQNILEEKLLALDIAAQEANRFIPLSEKRKAEISAFHQEAKHIRTMLENLDL